MKLSMVLRLSYLESQRDGRFTDLNRLINDWTSDWHPRGGEAALHVKYLGLQTAIRTLEREMQQYRENVVPMRAHARRARPRAGNPS